jgi:hypothetical protein
VYQREDGHLMDPTFDDFLALAEDRLTRAATAVSDGAKVGPATCAALSAVTRSLLILSTRYGQTPNGALVANWQPGFVDRLAAAHRRFQRHTGAGAPTRADELISDAARLLTVAQDLLATHLTTPDPPWPFARTPDGEDLLEASTRDHVLRRTADVAHHLSTLTDTVAVFDDLARERPYLADAYRPRDRDLAEAARDVADAAEQCAQPATAHLHISAAPVLAAPVTYPHLDEDPVVAAEQTRHALRRLATAAYQAASALRTGERLPVHTARNLREAAASLAVAHALAADMLTRLTPHLPLASGWNPGEVVDGLRAAGAAWARLLDPWAQTVSVPDSGPRSPLTVQAQSIAIRLGRLLYADPAWTPQTGPGQPRPLDHLLEPDTLHAICTTISELPRSAATIAANHAHLVTNGALELYSSDRSHRPGSGGRRFYPLQTAQRAELVAGYQGVTAACRTAATSLAVFNRGYERLNAMALLPDSGRCVVPTGCRRMARSGPQRLLGPEPTRLM